MKPIAYVISDNKSKDNILRLNTGRTQICAELIIFMYFHRAPFARQCDQ